MTTRTWNLDNAHTSIGFTVRHLLSKVRGHFATYSGAIELDEQDVRRSSVRVEIDAASIDTREPKRDAHLRSPDFFDVENHPKLTFVSKEILADGGKVTQVIGDLTIHGVTRQVTLDVEDLGRAKDPWGNEKLLFEATTQINRKDYGLNWNAVLETGGFLVGDKIEINLDLQAAAAAEQTAKAS
jgi:polyisoprenoid-binding protein YceI